MEVQDKIYLVGMIIVVMTFIYMAHRMIQRQERLDKEIFRGMMITPPHFTEGKIDDKTD